VNGGKILTPVLTLQAVFVKERLMAMGWTVKSATTGGITFATGENPRFLPPRQGPEKRRASPSFPAHSLCGGGSRVWPGAGLAPLRWMPQRGLGRGLYFGRPVVSEPHSGESSRQFGEKPGVALSRDLPWETGLLARFHQNDASREKSAILVCSCDIERHVWPKWCPAARRSTRCVARGQQSGV